jgi:hypothetical protein
MAKATLSVVAAALLILVAAGAASAQITTGTVAGTIKDAQGAVVPGATVVLISEARSTKSAPATTSGSGDFVFPNVTADTYTVEVTMDGFKTVRRSGVSVSGGDRVAVPPLTLEVGGAAETVTVTAEAALVQSQSAERSFAVTTEQIENLPVARGNFTSFTVFTPGVVSGGDGGGTRLGGVSQNNIMMDGASAMDTGNNGQMLQMNIESIGEVKILTQGYQAEYGRASGLQITAVTKSGSNRYRGSGYSVFTNSDWNETTWVREKNGDPTPHTEQKTLGYTIGGPIGRPGGANKLFFFYAHEYRPTTAAINNGNVIRLRVPTALERAGDFSQSLDNNGNLIPQLFDAANNRNFDNRQIPADRLYNTGINILKRYPLPNVTQAAGTNYNYEVQPPTTNDLIQQPALRLDYQMSSKLRFTGKYSGDRRRKLVTPGLIAGFSDVLNPYPYITNYAATVNYTMNPTTFVEGTYGFIRNELVGGNENGILVNDSANRLNGLADFPLLYKDAGVVDPRYYVMEVMQDVQPGFWDGTRINLPPTFSWGGRIGAAPPNQRYPGWLNINRTQDVALSLTKVAGRHTMKAGFYNNHSFKAQNAGFGALFQGDVNFGNDTNNALDSGFGYANAALGVFTRYRQASQLIEGNMIYNNREFYVQDNWKVSGRLTMDYGLRFTHQQPQHDKFGQMSNFFPDQWSAAQAPVFYVAGCSNGAATCSGNTRNAMDPRNNQILTAAGAANTQAAIGTPIPGSGNLLNGIRKAGDGIAKTGYVWPAVVVAPRFGIAYDLTGNQSTIFRAGGGLYFDRPDGNTIFGIPGNPPIATTQDLRNGQLQTIGQGLSTVAVPELSIFQYDAKVSGSWQWNAGVQRTLPWAMVADISYVGNRGTNRLTNFNLNAVDLGAAFLPQNQDPTLVGTSSVPGATAYSENILKPYRGLGNITQNTTDFWDEYHSLQTSLNRRFRNGFSLGLNYTYGISFKGNTGLVKRLDHAPDGTATLRADQADYEKLLETLDRRPHTIKANGVWSLPRAPSSFGRAVGFILNDWQLAGVLTAGSMPAYDLGFSYQNNGANVNLTGSHNYGARIAYVGDPGSGCSDNQYAQFNTASVTGPQPGSVGLESGRNILRNCADKRVDLSLQRDLRVGGARRLEFRVDVFNAFNAVVIDQRQTTVTYVSPTNLTVVNNQFNADGTLNASRSKPNNAGFGAATRALAMRNVQVQLRFQF